jgi:chemotaxis protein CheX
MPVRFADRELERRQYVICRAVSKGKLLIHDDTLLRSVVDSTTEVFLTMLGTDIRYTGVASGGPDPKLGIISMVGITGRWGGSGVFCCTPALANLICARMLGTDIVSGGVSVDEEVLDVVAEITNMMIGNVKNGLEPVTGPLAISVPTVIHGKNFHFRSGSGIQGLALGFTADGEVFEVRISLALVSEASPVRSRIPVNSLVYR